MSQIHCAVYINSTPWLLSNKELIHFLESELKENRKYEITGVSIYNEGAFIHYIEGARSHLEYKYTRIKGSLLYRGVIELFSEKIKCRRFNEWHMGFLQPHEIEILNNSSKKWWHAASSLNKQDKCDSLELLDIFCKNESRFMRKI